MNKKQRNKEIAGQKFGRLTAIYKYGKDKWNKVWWVCQCECGNQKYVSISRLTSGNTRSCGCLRFKH